MRSFEQYCGNIIDTIVTVLAEPSAIDINVKKLATWPGNV